MTDCVRCGNRDYLCQQCKHEELEDRHGTPADQDPDLWVLVDGLWHASVAFDGEIHTCNCGETAAIPVTRTCADLRHIPEKYDAPVCRKCATTLEGHRQETVPEDATFERASELRADGGTITEGELVDRAVREAVDLVEAGDSRAVAVGYVVDEHELGHRRDDVDQRVRDRINQTVATDGGVDQSSSGTVQCEQCNDADADVRPVMLEGNDEPELVCDGCYPDVEIDRAADQKRFGYGPHGQQQDTETEPVTDGGRDPEELVVVTCDPCDYQTGVAVGALPMTSCPDCQGDLKIDDDHVVHKCPDATGFNHVTVEKGERCPFCQTVQGQPIATDGGVDEDDEYYVVDENRAAVVAGPFTSKENAAEEALDRGPDHIVATEGSLELIALTSNTTIRWENDDVHGSDGMRCHECGHEHDDWTKDGKHTVDDGHHAGIIERWKCGICGAITESGRR